MKQDIQRIAPATANISRERHPGGGIMELSKKRPAGRSYSNQCFCNASINKVIFAVNNLTAIAKRIIPKNLRII